MRNGVKHSTTMYDKLLHLDPAHEDIVAVNWCLGNTCNFSCSYCPKILHDGSIPWIPIDTILPFVDGLMDHYEEMGKKLYVEFTGGEVTLFKDFLRLAEALKARGQWTGIISNGSRTPRFWEQAKGLIDHACISYHSEEGNADHLISTVNQIEADVDCHVNVMLKPDPDVFDESIEVARRIVTETRNISFDLQTLLVDFSSVSYDYTDEQRAVVAAASQEFKKIARDRRTRKHNTYRGTMRMVGSGVDEHRTAGNFISTRTNNWEGWSCNAGLEQLIIDFNGEIYRGWCKQGGLVGTVYDEKVDFPTKPIVCGTNFCHCNFDIMSTKERI